MEGRAETLLGELNGVVESAQRILAEYLPPNSAVSEHEALNRLFEVLDGPLQRRVQGQVRELLGERSALF